MNLIEEYTNYVDNGGKIILHTPSNYNLEDNKYVKSINNFGGKITENIIEYTNGGIIYVKNLTSISEFDGVKSIGIHGPEILPSNSSQIILGWHFTKNNNIQNYLSIGIKCEIGDGLLYIMSGSSMLINDNFKVVNDNYDQFLINIIYS